MRILIAGGAGYIGSALVPRLLERGYEIDVIDLLWFGNHLPSEVTILPKDLFDLKEIDLAGYDQVIFAAGLSNDPMAEFSPSKNFIFNGAAPAYLCYIAKQAKVRRFIYASSCSVYGYTENEFSNEDRPVASAYPYGISKLQGERATIQLADKDFSVISLRQGTVSGYSPRMRYDLIVNTMFKCAMQEGIIRVNNPAIWRPILSIQDATTAYIRAVEAYSTLTGIFNAASGNFTVGEVADIVKDTIYKETGKTIALSIQHIQDIRNYKVSIDKASTILSFHPDHSIQSITKNLIQNMDKCSDWDNPNYYNIKVLKQLEERNAARS